jgi:uncharacterized protein YdaU (DUF1376 family)
MAYWTNQGPLLISRLKSIVKTSDENWQVIEEFFDTKSIPGKWQHGRIDKEIALSIRIKEVRKEAGKVGGGNPNFQKGKQNPYYADKQKDKQTDKQNDNQKINPSPSPSQLLKEKQKYSRAQYKAEPEAETIEPKKQLVLEKLKETMLKFPDSRYQHNIQLFVQAKWNKNDDAIIHCLNQLINSKKSISYPKSYLESILAKENGNFNERESIQEHATHKADIPVQDIPRLGEVLKVMGAR